MDEERRKKNNIESEMDEERRKRTRRTTLDQLEEGRFFAVLETIESESNSGDTSAASNQSDTDFEDDFQYSSDEEYLYGGIQYEQADFSGDEYNNEYGQDVEEDDVDPDQLSYEELIALGEMVGVESRGLSESEISKHLHPLTCQCAANLLIDRCVICQLEYEPGEKLVTLPCDHPYHRDCIAQWLQIKKICPICNNEISSPEISTTTKQ